MVLGVESHLGADGQLVVDLGALGQGVAQLKYSRERQLLECGLWYTLEVRKKLPDISVARRRLLVFVRVLNVQDTSRCTS